MPLKIRNGILHIDFRFRGKRLRITTGLQDTDANYKVACQWDGAIQREIKLGTFRIENHFPHFRPQYFRTPDSTFEARARSWLEAHRQSWAEWTYRKFKGNLEARVFPKIGSRNYKEITIQDIRLLRESIIGEGTRKGTKLANRGVNKIMQPVVAFFTELFGDGEIVSNPAARLKRLKEKRVAEIAPFSEAETAILFKEARKHYPHYADYVEHNFESGFRLEENNGLLWPRVNFVSETIAIREARVLGKQKEPKTEGAIRDAEITEGMMQCLKRQKARSYLRHEHVWVTEKGRPIDVSNFRSEVWVPLLKLAGIDYRYPNQARHTFATRHIKRGTDPRWICKQMGTSLEMLFDTYTAEFDRARGDDGHKRGHKAVSRAVKK